MTTALRTGVALPFGRIASGPGNGMPTVHAYQVPLLLESGYRPTPWLSIGAYGGIAFGAEKSTSRAGLGDARRAD